MLNKAKLAGLATVVLLLACLAFLVLGSTRKHSSSFQQLSDGSVLRLDYVSFTNGQQNYTGKYSTGWRAKIIERIPSTWKARFGWSTMGGRMTLTGSGLGTNLAIFTVCEMTRRASFLAPRVTVFDEFGNAFNGGNARGTSLSLVPGQMMRADGWVFPAFPRRGKILGFRFFAGTNHDSTPVAEFTIPNPAPGNYPTWSPEPLPATQTNGDLSVTLTEFKCGLSRSNPLLPATNYEPAFSQANFTETQTGQLSNSWQPVSLEISDATGNRWITAPYSYVASGQQTPGPGAFAFADALPTGESALKLRFAFSRISDFDTNELCTFTGIPVPDAATTIPLDNTTNVGGVGLQLLAISGEQVQQPEIVRSLDRKTRSHLSLHLDHLAGGKRLTLVKITDDTGREVSGNRVGPGSSSEIYSLDVPAGARQLTFAFAIHKNRYVEFVVKPELAGGRANQAKP